jgi:serine/threonine protein kinase
MIFFLKVVEKIFMSLLSGVYSLHHEGIIHRDIKPSNIFVELNNLHFVLGIFNFFFFVIIVILLR